MKFMSESAFRNFQKYFWWAYVLLPFFTGLLTYHWLPDESYDERRHELLASRTVDTNPIGGSENTPQEWRSKISGRIYTPASFAEHRHSEAIRMSIIAFLYGLIGCFVFAYGQINKKLSTFIVAFKSTLFYDAAISILILFFVW